MNNHTTAKLGKRVFVILRDGKKIEGKLLFSGSGFVEISAPGQYHKIQKTEIRSMSILRRKE